MSKLSDWQFDYIDGGTANEPGVCVRLTLPVEMVLRGLYCYFDRANILTSATAEKRQADVVFRVGGVETIRIPACVVPVNNVRFGFAQNSAAYADSRSSVAGTLFWNTTDTTGLDYAINPFYLKTPADEVYIEHNYPSAVARIFLGVMSFSNSDQA